MLRPFIKNGNYLVLCEPETHEGAAGLMPSMFQLATAISRNFHFSYLVSLLQVHNKTNDDRDDLQKLNPSLILKLRRSVNKKKSKSDLRKWKSDFIHNSLPSISGLDNMLELIALSCVLSTWQSIALSIIC